MAHLGQTAHLPKTDSPLRETDSPLRKTNPLLRKSDSLFNMLAGSVRAFSLDLIGIIAEYCAPKRLNFFNMRVHRCELAASWPGGVVGVYNGCSIRYYNRNGRFVRSEVCT